MGFAPDEAAPAVLALARRRVGGGDPIRCVPFDPLSPDAPHAPADGTPGVVVGDDTGGFPRIECRRPRPPLVVIGAALLVLLTLAVAVVWAAPAAGVEWRARAVARCCDRPPLARDAVTLPARTSTEPTQEEPL